MTGQTPPGLRERFDALAEPAAVRAALLRYRVVAYVVGVGLVVLVFIGVPLRYLAGQPGVVHVVGAIHGFLFIVYVLLTLELGLRCRWHLVRTVLVALAGTIPFLSFVAERNVTAWVRTHVEPRTAGGVTRGVEVGTRPE